MGKVGNSIIPLTGKEISGYAEGMKETLTKKMAGKDILKMDRNKRICPICNMERTPSGKCINGCDD